MLYSSQNVFLTSFAQIDAVILQATIPIGIVFLELIEKNSTIRKE